MSLLPENATVVTPRTLRPPAVSIGGKLIVLLSLSGCSGLALSALALIAYNGFTAQEGSRRELDLAARAVAEQATTALSTRNRKAAAEALSALRVNSLVQTGCLYTGQTLVAAYPSGADSRCSPLPPTPDSLPPAGHLLLVKPLTLKGDTIGLLSVGSDLSTLRLALRDQLIITAGVLLASLALSIFIATRARNLIAGPVLRLAAVARQVSETRNYRLRAPVVGRDEVGRLIADFNQMLDQIAQRDRDLQERQVRLGAIFENAVVGIFVIGRTGLVESFNPASERLFGYTRGEIQGGHFSVLLPDAGAAQGEAGAGHLAGIASMVGGVAQCSARRKDGGRFPVEVFIGEMILGGERRYTALISDVTERHKAQDEMRRLNRSLEDQVRETSEALRQLRDTQAQLVQAEKMASLGALVAGVAHEINTPVGVGVTAASTLLNQAGELKEAYQANKLTRSELDRFVGVAQEATQMILKNLQRAADLIQSFKQVAVDQSSGERRRFQLDAYLREVLLSLRPKYRSAGIEIEVNCPPQLVVDSYPGALAQILTNLVSNSVMHAFAAGKPGLMRIDVALSEGWIELCFADNGAGIAAEHLPRIFDPFFTTRRARGGSGLGLHIVFNLVTQLLKGTISASSEPGKGAVFTIRFPALGVSAAGATAAAGRD